MKFLLLLAAAFALDVSAVKQLRAPIITNLLGFHSSSNSVLPPSWIFFNYTNTDPKANVQTTCRRYVTSAVDSLFDGGEPHDYFTGYHECDDASVSFSFKEGYQLYLKVSWNSGDINPVTGHRWPDCWGVAPPSNESTQAISQHDAPPSGTLFIRDGPVEQPLQMAVC